MTDREVFLGVVRTGGEAMFHRQDCNYGRRSMSAQFYTADDFQKGDVWCSRCCGDIRRGEVQP